MLHERARARTGRLLPARGACAYALGLHALQAQARQRVLRTRAGAGTCAARHHTSLLQRACSRSRSSLGRRRGLARRWALACASAPARKQRHPQHHSKCLSTPTAQCQRQPFGATGVPNVSDDIGDPWVCENAVSENIKDHSTSYNVMSTKTFGTSGLPTALG